MNDLHETVALVQPDSVKTMITFSFVGLETITGIVLAVLLFFLDVEKTVTIKQHEIRLFKGMEETQEEHNAYLASMEKLSDKDKKKWENERILGEKMRQEIQKEMMEESV